jgi:hypothetical protein
MFLIQSCHTSLHFRRPLDQAILYSRSTSTDQQQIVAPKMAQSIGKGDKPSNELTANEYALLPLANYFLLDTNLILLDGRTSPYQTGTTRSGFFIDICRLTMPRFKCRQCNKFKLPAHFSNKEIKNYQFKKSCKPNIDGVTAELRCRSCTGEQVHELRCEGPCGIKKPLGSFSKTQRRRGLKVSIATPGFTLRHLCR